MRALVATLASLAKGCDVALGNRTYLTQNYADGAAAGPAYAAAGLNGNSIASSNGTLRYILPAPLGYWIGPTRESELFQFGTVGTETISVVVKASNVQEYNPLDRKAPDTRINLAPDFRIDEDFPFRCLPVRHPRSNSGPSQPPSLR